MHQKIFLKNSNSCHDLDNTLSIKNGLINFCPKWHILILFCSLILIIDSQVIYTNKRQVWRCLLLSTTRRDETTKESKTRSPRLHVRTNTKSHSQNPKSSLVFNFSPSFIASPFLFSFSLPLFTHKQLQCFMINCPNAYRYLQT